MTEKSYFGYWCKHCKCAHTLYDNDVDKYVKYLGLKSDGYYWTRVKCPM